MEEFVLEEVYDFVWLSIISFKIVSLFILMLALNFCLHSYQVYDMNYIIKLIQIQQKKLSIDCQLVFSWHQLFLVINSPHVFNWYCLLCYMAFIW